RRDPGPLAFDAVELRLDRCERGALRQGVAPVAQPVDGKVVLLEIEQAFEAHPGGRVGAHRGMFGMSGMLGRGTLICGVVTCGGWSCGTVIAGRIPPGSVDAVVP